MTKSLAWYVARSSGITAWVLVCIDVYVGVAFSTKLTGRRPGGKWLLDIHRFTGGLAFAFIAVHIAGLMADRFVPFGPVQVLVPMASHYRPAAVAAGIVAFYLLLAVEITSLFMKRIPRPWWRRVHSAAFAVFLLTSLHVMTAGTDAANRVLRVAALVIMALFVFLVTFRWLVASGRTSRATMGRVSAPKADAA